MFQLELLYLRTICSHCLWNDDFIKKQYEEYIKNNVLDKNRDYNFIDSEFEKILIHHSRNRMNIQVSNFFEKYDKLLQLLEYIQYIMYLSELQISEWENNIDQSSPLCHYQLEDAKIENIKMDKSNNECTIYLTNVKAYHDARISKKVPVHLVNLILNFKNIIKFYTNVDDYNEIKTSVQYSYLSKEAESYNCFSLLCNAGENYIKIEIIFSELYIEVSADPKELAECEKTYSEIGYEHVPELRIPESRVKQLSLMNPELFLNVRTYDEILSCAFEVLTLYIDSIIAEVGEPFTTLATQGIPLVVESLLKIKNNKEDAEARKKMAGAVSMMGAMISLPCYVSHGIGLTLSEKYMISHGLASAVCLPQLLKLYAKYSPKQTKIVAEAWKIPISEHITSEELGKLMHNEALEFMKNAGYPSLEKSGISLKQATEAVKEIRSYMEDAACLEYIDIQGYMKIMKDAY